jgi:hypothetical protein
VLDRQRSQRGLLRAIRTTPRDRPDDTDRQQAGDQDTGGKPKAARRSGPPAGH